MCSSSAHFLSEEHAYHATSIFSYDLTAAKPTLCLPLPNICDTMTSNYSTAVADRAKSSHPTLPAGIVCRQFLRPETRTPHCRPFWRSRSFWRGTSWPPRNTFTRCTGARCGKHRERTTRTAMILRYVDGEGLAEIVVDWDCFQWDFSEVRVVTGNRYRVSQKFCNIIIVSVEMLYF